jgi:hypothetical protein
MRSVRPAALLVALLALGFAAGTARSGTAAPTGLHPFMLRADEAVQTSFSRTPSFAWNPVPGADHYEFQLSLSSTFRDNSVIYADLHAVTPVEAPPLTLPWISGNPHSLYARVRAITAKGATPWSAAFGFDMAPPPPPTPLSSYPGLLRWTPVDGALGYQVWLLDAHKMEVVSTNVLDEREFYTFHQGANWTGTVRWRVRALREDNSVQGQGRLNSIPAVQYGAWSPAYSSTNPPFAGGPIKLVGTVSDVFSDGNPKSPAHRLMPAFVWSGDQGLSGQSTGLFRVYVFTDKQCLNRVFASAVLGGPAYAPRGFGPLRLPTTAAAVATALTAYLDDGTEPASYTFDGEKITPSEQLPDATPTTAVPGTPGDTSTTSSTTTSSTPPSSGSTAGPAAGTIQWTGRFGAPTDLWDVNWPESGYYWTVVPVVAEAPVTLSVNVAGAGAKAGDTTLSVTSGQGFNVGDLIAIGSGQTAEDATVTGVSASQLTLAAKLDSGHGPGEVVSRLGGSLVYHDVELAQDACAAGRVARFGRQSAPSLTSSGEVFATGLSSDGRLTSARHTTAFYGQPLISWTPALGAEAYEVQWSKTAYPFVPEQDPTTTTKGFMTTSTSVVLHVGPGVWWYRVRGFDYSLPTGAQQMSWSDPAKLVVAKPQFKIVGGASSPAKATKPQTGKTSATPAAGLKRAAGDGFRMDVPTSWQRVTLKDSVVTFAYRDPNVRNAFRANVNILRGSGRAGRSFASWTADLAAQLRSVVSATPSTSIVTLPAGRAVRLVATAPANGHPLRVLQYYVDAGSKAYVVTFECSAASYSSYAATFAKSITSLHLG